jgi:hypothetical protein
MNSQRFHKTAHLTVSPFALKQTQKNLAIASPMATIGIGICLKSSGGVVVALFWARRPS